jgi:endonuclease/exonuclease/phosphatase family metal-dependent hydrolase
VQSGEFGLIDHIAISESFASMASSPDVWQRENSLGQVMSDHCGVAIEFI